jgi:aconitate hydratase
VKQNFLASPPASLASASALAGTVDIDLTSQPLGTGSDGQPVYLRDIWPSHADVVRRQAREVADADVRDTHAAAFDGDERWREVPTSNTVT